MKSSIHLGKIAGIDVHIHYSLFAVMALVSWSLASGFLPSRYPEWSDSAYWAIGILSALLLFASVLIHELAHSVVARARGFPVGGITLFLLGGISSLRAESRRPRDEFVISVVGPMASLGLAIASWAARGVFGDTSEYVEAVLRYLVLMNLMLGVFNLLPAFPLDGGRLVRSLVWVLTGSLSKATRVTARGGQAFGIGLIAVGVLLVLRGNFLEGLWMALIGWYLFSAAASSLREM